MDKSLDKTTMLLTGELVSSVHHLNLSLEDPDAYELSPEQEAEIRKRIRKVKSGKAGGRPAAEILGEIEARLK